MSMTQLIIGTALGFFVAQGVLYGIRHLIGWLQRSDARKRILKPTRSLGSALISAFIKYAAPVGAGAAVITLCVWAVGDHLAAKSARSAATADVFKRSTLVPASDPHGSPDELARTASVSRVGRSPALAADNVAPYGERFESQGDSPAAVRSQSLRGTAQGDSTAPVPVAVRLRGCRPRRQVPQGRT